VGEDGKCDEKKCDHDKKCDDEEEPVDVYHNVGGAMKITGGNVVIKKSWFETSEAGGGGALYVSNGATVNLVDTYFFLNEATAESGQLDANGDAVVCIACLLGRDRFKENLTCTLCLFT